MVVVEEVFNTNCVSFSFDLSFSVGVGVSVGVSVMPCNCWYVSKIDRGAGVSGGGGGIV